ncbi:MAG: hypothetical protein IJU76_09410 [Desulfovibrionaceae bacterium]|nr:hypothetical protein [Desulfovibrionaceae bacterium]
MGYRSEVGLALSRKGVEILHARLNSPEVSDDLREHVLSLLERADERYRDAKSGLKHGVGTGLICFADVRFIADTLQELARNMTIRKSLGDFGKTRLNSNCHEG